MISPKRATSALSWRINATASPLDFPNKSVSGYRACYQTKKVEQQMFHLSSSLPLFDATARSQLSEKLLTLETGLARKLKEGNCSSELEATRAVGSVPTRGRTFISKASPAVRGIK
ncbi:hypothetical protein PIB30_078583 [Stylosanthes scabra]|uniref:Uncharacterized protein n=1 Tax=Stylosanthes scabra TaxID=79078 RepID=A0ABU6XQC0_9FABA|nr:hypothetical protein [Stylosanthes scabra]